MAILNQGQQQAQGQQLAPEKQAQADKAFQMAEKMMWNKATFDAIMTEVQKDPVNGISDAVVMTLNKAKEAMGGLDKEAALLAGMVLMTRLIEAINETGRAKLDGDVFTKALDMAVQKYLMVSQAGGEQMNDVQQLMQSFGGA